MRNIRHQTSDIRHQTSDIRHQTSDIRHQTSDIRHRTSDIGHRTSDIETAVMVTVSENGILTSTKTVTPVDGIFTFTDLTLTGLMGEAYILSFSATIESQGISAVSQPVTLVDDNIRPTVVITGPTKSVTKAFPATVTFSDW